jgi:flagella basal body P-ring formation protein FlgA
MWGVERRTFSGPGAGFAAWTFLLGMALAGKVSASAAADAAKAAIVEALDSPTRELSVRILPTRHDLGACEAPRASLANRSINRSGRLFVSVQCRGDGHGTIYLPAQVTVHGNYVVAAERVPAGTLLDRSMLELRRGDITALLDSAVLRLQDAEGRVAGRGLAPGAVVRQQSLRELQLVERGQPVSFEILGRGFRIAGKGEALQDGNPGDLIRVRTDRRRTVAGVVSQRGIVLVEP